MASPTQTRSVRAQPLDCARVSGVRNSRVTTLVTTPRAQRVMSLWQRYRQRRPNCALSAVQASAKPAVHPRCRSRRCTKSPRSGSRRRASNGRVCRRPSRRWRHSSAQPFQGRRAPLLPVWVPRPPTAMCSKGATTGGNRVGFTTQCAAKHRVFSTLARLNPRVSRDKLNREPAEKSAPPASS